MLYEFVSGSYQQSLIAVSDGAELELFTLNRVLSIKVLWHIRNVVPSEAELKCMFCLQGNRKCKHYTNLCAYLLMNGDMINQDGINIHSSIE